MKTALILKLLKSFQETFSDWKGLLCRFMDDDMEDGDAAYKTVFELVDAIRETYKTEEKIPDAICSAMDDDELVTTLDEYLQQSLRWFSDLKLLRIIQTDKTEQSRAILDTIMDEFVIHCGMNGIQKIMKLLRDVPDKDEGTIKALIRALNHFTILSVEENENEESMAYSLQHNGLISEENSRYIAKKIWDNRIELKLDYIIRQFKKDE